RSWWRRRTCRWRSQRKRIRVRTKAWRSMATSKVRATRRAWKAAWRGGGAGGGSGRAGVPGGPGAPPAAGGNATPGHPGNARASGKTDTVILKIVVLANGSVGDVQVMRGEEPFASAAVAAVKKWHYEPAKYKGQPITVFHIIRIPFKLTV